MVCFTCAVNGIYSFDARRAVRARWIRLAPKTNALMVPKTSVDARLAARLRWPGGLAAGQVDLGKEYYSGLLGRIDTRDALWRPLQWNYGWDLFRAGQADAALAQWTELVGSRGATAAWMPPTLALALWTVGRKDEAVQWYAAAVRTEPRQWGTPGNFVTLLPDWRDSERATLAEVQAAWVAKPPTWP